MENESIYLIKREIRDIETYIERMERDPSIHNKDFMIHKKMRLEELKAQLNDLNAH